MMFVYDWSIFKKLKRACDFHKNMEQTCLRKWSRKTSELRGFTTTTSHNISPHLTKSHHISSHHFTSHHSSSVTLTARRPLMIWRKHCVRMLKDWGWWWLTIPQQRSTGLYHLVALRILASRMDWKSSLQVCLVAGRTFSWRMKMWWESWCGVPAMSCPSATKTKQENLELKLEQGNMNFQHILETLEDNELDKILEVQKSCKGTS